MNVGPQKKNAGVTCHNVLKTPPSHDSSVTENMNRASFLKPYPVSKEDKIKLQHWGAYSTNQVQFLWEFFFCSFL